MRSDENSQDCTVPLKFTEFRFYHSMKSLTDGSLHGLISLSVQFSFDECDGNAPFFAPLRWPHVSRASAWEMGHRDVAPETAGWP